jgi:hypothetical protein
MAGNVFSGVLSLAVLEVSWLHDYASAMLAGTLAVRVSVAHAHRHRVRDLARPWRAALILSLHEPRSLDCSRQLHR